jgi:hypothetical protein
VNRSWVGPAIEPPPGNFRDGIRPGVTIRRIVGLPPEWAEVALRDTLCPASPDGSGTDGTFFATVGESLLLRSSAVTDDGYGTRRRLVGWLVSKRGWFQLPVELELAEWSSSASELTLRPLHGSHRPGWGRWYLGVGSAAMDRVVAAVRFSP